MPPTDRTSSVITEQLRRASGEAVIRIWSNLPQEVQDHLFNEAVASQGESIRSQSSCMTSIRAPRTRWATRAKRRSRTALAVSGVEAGKSGRC